MNFDFTEEQVMLRDSVARFVQDEYDFDTRCGIVASEHGFSAEKWATFAELGWLSIPFAEEHGGFGGSAADVMVVMEQLGKGLVAEPYTPTVLLFGGLIEAAGSAEQKEAWLPRIIGGEVQGAFAYVEAQSRYALADVQTTAVASDGGYTLNGSKTVVYNGSAADALVVSARTSGVQSDEAGISLFLVDANSAGIEKTVYRLMDGQVVANISFTDVAVAADALLGAQDQGFAVMEQVVDSAILAQSAEALGAMEKLNATTVEYARTREQFGVAIGSFQALQHRMVDTFMSYEQAKSILYRAVCSVLEGADDVKRDLHALKVLIDKNGKHVAAEAIQLHGGMGITDELDVGHYMKRILTLCAAFGNGDHHQQQFNALSYG